MATISVSLPEPLEAFINEQVAHGGHASGEEYIRKLIAAARREALRAEIDEMLRSAATQLDAGLGVEMTDEAWAAIEHRIAARIDSGADSQG